MAAKGFSRYLTPTRVAAGLGLAAAGGAAWGLVEVRDWRRRNVVQGPTGSVAEREVARIPCSRLAGYDCVVRYRFAQRAGGESAEAASGTLATSRTSWWTRLRGSLQAENLNDTEAAVEDSGEFSTGAIRRVVRATDPVPAAPSSPPATPWPAGADMFAALTIEPSAGGGLSLRATLDACTEQTFVQCKASARHRQDSGRCEVDASVLLAPYLRTMLAAFAFFPFPIPGPLRVCQLGVGGGAMPMFLQAHFGGVIGTLDLVDVEPAVLQAAAGHMGLAKTMRSGDLRLCAEDGLAFIERVAQGQATKSWAHPPYDVLLVDLFVGSRVVPYVDTAPFAVACRDALTPRGVIAVNSPQRSDELHATLKRVFGDANVFALPCSPNANVVYVAARNFGGSVAPIRERRHVAWRCSELSRRHALPFDVSAGLPLQWWLW